MPRAQPPSRSDTGDSTKSAGGSTRDHELSVNFYSEQNGHWGAYIRERGATHGTIHHVRSDTQRDQDKFFYDERPMVFQSQSLYGSSRVAALSRGEASKAQASIRSYASNSENIPSVSTQTNCQSFVGGALGRLEQDRVLKPGHSAYFAQQYGRHGKEIGENLQRDGRHFELSENQRFTGEPAARFNDKSTRPQPKKLNMTAFGHLSR
ncbi:hypothetical protein F5Y16DRAFT_154498 [Xylariaceae sp. FL0255]|nr:hypothetical protein F5Y16DRAFT_154498 [Xylariaceae sp. FL0255]